MRSAMTGVAMILALSAWAEGQKLNFKGLYGLEVVIAKVGEEVGSEGVDDAMVRSIVEERLKKEGMVLYPAQSVKNKPYLLVKVTAIPIRSGDGKQVLGWAISHRLDVYELVSLLRRPSSGEFASTWTRSGLVSGPAGYASRLTKKAVWDSADHLARDWSAGK